MNRKPTKRKALKRSTAVQGSPPKKRKKPAKQSLGSAIKEARTKRGLTQLALANAIGLQGEDAGACVARWETGVYAPTLKNLSLIARALGINVGSLIGAAGK